MSGHTIEAPVTAVELADEVLRCSVEKVYRMARAKEIPSIKVGREYRFYPSEVKAKLAAPLPKWSQSARSLGRKRAA